VEPHRLEQAVLGARLAGGRTDEVAVVFRISPAVSASSDGRSSKAGRRSTGIRRSVAWWVLVNVGECRRRDIHRLKVLADNAFASGW
jgi:hypothetical protein